MPSPDKRWQPPPPLHHFKLNVDGALRSNSGSCGVRVVVRDSYGCLCGALAIRAPSLLSILATELYALKIGISFAVDSIQLLLQEDSCYAAEGPLVDDIRRLLASFPSYSAHFVPYTANWFENGVAQFSLGQDDLAFWLANARPWLGDCMFPCKLPCLL